MMTENPQGLRVLEVTSRCAMGEVDGCLAVVWRQQPSPDAFRTRNEHLGDLARRSPGRCALVELVEANAKPPSQDDRRVAMEVFKQLGSDLSAIAFVLEGNEMRAALIRAVLTGMMFFVRQLQPTKVFKHVPDMAQWLQPHLKTENANFASDIAAALEHLRRLLDHEGAARS